MIETTEYGYVIVDSPRGNDATARRDSWDNPFATLSKAFSVVRENDTVLVYPGPYVETPQEPTQVQGPGGGAPLWLSNLQHVTIRGMGRPTVWFRTHGNGLTIENCSDIRVDGLHFRGAGMITDPKDYYFALLLCNGYNDSLQIQDCIFSESGDHGIAHLFGPRTTNNCIIQGNTFTTGGNLNHPILGRDGAAIALGGSGNLIYGNLIQYWLRGMEYESGNFTGQNAPTSQNIFAHNKLLQCWWEHMIITPTHLQASLFDQILIEDNILQGWDSPPEVDLGPNNTFGNEGIYFAGGVNAIIRGNNICDMWDGNGIRMTADWGNIQDVLVTENRIYNAGRAGILALSSPASASVQAFKVTRCRIANNKVGPCGGRGIWVNGDYNVVESNDVQECGSGSDIWEGLYLEGGRRNLVARNRLIDCLPLANKGVETKAADNDQYWETKAAP